MRYHDIRSNCATSSNQTLKISMSNIEHPIISHPRYRRLTCTELSDVSLFREVSIHDSGHSMGFEELFPWDAVGEFRTNDASHGAQQLIRVTFKAPNKNAAGSGRSLEILGDFFGRFKEDSKNIQRSIKQQLKEFAKCCLGLLSLLGRLSLNIHCIKMHSTCFRQPGHSWPVRPDS